MSSLYLGIDPGAQGFLCFLDPLTGHSNFYPTPSTELSPMALTSAILEIMEEHQIIRAGIEDVHAIFGTSAGSNFKFGFNTGMLHGIVQGLGIGLDLIKPREWQRTIKAPTIKKAGGKAKFKRVIANTALRLYPHADLYGPKGGLIDGRADALMIAHHMVVKYGGVP